MAGIFKLLASLLKSLVNTSFKVINIIKLNGTEKEKLFTVFTDFLVRSTFRRNLGKW